MSRNLIAVSIKKWDKEQREDAKDARRYLTSYLHSQGYSVRDIDDAEFEKPDELFAQGIRFVIIPKQRSFYESRFAGLVKFAQLGGKVLATYSSFLYTEKDEEVIDKRLYGLYGILNDVDDREIRGTMVFSSVSSAKYNWLFKNLPPEIYHRDGCSGYVGQAPEDVSAGEWRITSARYDDNSQDSQLRGKNTPLCLVKKWAQGGLFVYTCFDYESQIERNEIFGKLIENMSDHSGQLTSRNDIFIAHGQDETAKESVARFVERLGPTVVILHEQPNVGRTIIEKFEDHSNVAFAIVLLTPDDIGAPNDKKGETKPRARQNVILELGYFMGKLGRGRVCALYKEGIEIPSDYQGVLYIPMDSAGAWKMELAKEIKNAGIEVDLNKL